MKRFLLFPLLSVFFLFQIKSFSQEISPQKTKYVYATLPKCGTHLTRTVLYTVLTEEQLSSLEVINNHLVPSMDIYRDDPSLKKIIVIRDLRDMCVSASYWIPKKGWFGDSIDYDDFRARDHQGQLDYIIHLDHEEYSIKAFARRAKQWMDSPNVFIVRFEDIVGEKGGGDRQRQIKAIQDLVDYLGFTVPLERIEYAADTVFGSRQPIGKSTFRKGTIGQWREEFTDEQIEAFKENLGQELILLGYEKDLNWSR